MFVHTFKLNFSNFLLKILMQSVVIANIKAKVMLKKAIISVIPSPFISMGRLG